MANFTQEKWQLDEDAGIVHTDDKGIAQVFYGGKGKYSTEEGNANARLIQAAPTMYAFIYKQAKDFADIGLNLFAQEFFDFLSSIDGKENVS